MQNPFYGLYKQLFDVSQYLTRLGMKIAPAASVEGLAALMHAHATHIPFENLDVFHGHKEPCLDTDALYEKLIIKKRGGYCFELNGLFWRLLESLGFDAWCCIARIAFHRDFLSPPAHRVILVSIDGQTYFCDVGFGGPVPSSPIAIRYGDVQTCSAGRRYRFLRDEDYTVLQIEQDGTFESLLIFSEKSVDPVDFIPLNAFCSRSMHEPFLRKQIIWRLTETGKISVDGDVLRIVENGCTTQLVITTEEELRDVWLRYFDLVYDAPLRSWR